MPDERPIDGVSLLPLLRGRDYTRSSAIPFWHRNKLALHDGSYKLLMPPDQPDKAELYNLVDDRAEEVDIIADHPEMAAEMRARLEAFTASARNSDEGRDY